MASDRSSKAIHEDLLDGLADGGNDGGVEQDSHV